MRSQCLQTVHYPVTAQIQARFRKLKPKQHKPTLKYDYKQFELDPDDMNKYFSEHIGKTNSTCYEAWMDRYTTYISNQTPKERTKRQSYISRKTWEMVQERSNTEQHMWRDEREALDRDIKKGLQADKKQWHRNQVQQNMSNKNRWRGVKLIKKEFKPKTYARRDMYGNVITLDERAEYISFGDSARNGRRNKTVCAWPLKTSKSEAH